MFLLLFALAITLSSAPAYAQQSDAEQIAAVIQEHLAAFERQADCSSEELETAKREAVNAEQTRTSYNAPDAQLLLPYASILLDVADSAARVGCSAIANDIYHYIIGKYVGFVYGGLSDRAIVGLGRTK